MPVTNTAERGESACADDYEACAQASYLLKALCSAGRGQSKYCVDEIEWWKQKANTVAGHAWWRGGKKKPRTLWTLWALEITCRHTLHVNLSIYSVLQRLTAEQTTILQIQFMDCKHFGSCFLSVGPIWVGNPAQINHIFDCSTRKIKGHPNLPIRQMNFPVFCSFQRVHFWCAVLHKTGWEVPVTGTSSLWTQRGSVWHQSLRSCPLRTWRDMCGLRLIGVVSENHSNYLWYTLPSVTYTGVTFDLVGSVCIEYQ